MKTLFVAMSIVALSLTPALAADSAVSSIGQAASTAAKDTATQAAKDKAQEKLGTSTVPTMPTKESAKEAAKDKAQEKTNSAINKALGQ